IKQGNIPKICSQDTTFSIVLFYSTTYDHLIRPGFKIGSYATVSLLFSRMPDRVITQLFKYCRIYLVGLCLCFLEAEDVLRVCLHPFQQSFTQCRSDTIEVVT